MCDYMVVASITRRKSSGPEQTGLEGDKGTRWYRELLDVLDFRYIPASSVKFLIDRRIDDMPFSLV